jgi:hypothetical protein
MSGKFKSYKSWREKLENPPPGLPKVVNGPATWEKRFGGRMVLVPTPLLVDSLIRKVKKGKLITVTQIRTRLAKDFKADSTCPLTTGIFIRIAAETAEEDLRNGKNMSRAQSREQVTPYWRVIGADGTLTNPKLPGGFNAQAARLKEEGHKIVPAKGKKPPKVQDFEKALV